MCLSGFIATVEVRVTRGVDDFDVFDRLCGTLTTIGFEFLLTLGPVRVFINLARHASSFFNIHSEFIVDNKKISKLEANKS